MGCVFTNQTIRKKFNVTIRIVVMSEMSEMSNFKLPAGKQGAESGEVNDKCYTEKSRLRWDSNPRPLGNKSIAGPPSLPSHRWERRMDESPSRYMRTGVS